ncbi:MerR family transcriptional regulator [Paenibacillus prosopidis]|uniref:MerR family mercuric resistance operon transcriptional regulator n=1 Tax=Paenibacillus prosopidis TaxID=630520 RepID=A0A368W1W6_9BACL|nr:MerR family transcriptional regulator [Paenibacillus prosopidis]RCW49027.1 MerR family mercuric resistance operon transcriptional regulator [Paenibacillus prosopidis]
MKGLTISQVARASNVNVETVKYYEKRKLLSKPDRNESGYRIFSEDTVNDVKFIKKAQGFGFTLNEIKHLLALVKQEDYYPSKEMYAFATAKVKEIEEKITQLENFKSLLEQVTLLPAHTLPLLKQECPVLKKIKKG